MKLILFFALILSAHLASAQTIYVRTMDAVPEIVTSVHMDIHLATDKSMCTIDNCHQMDIYLNNTHVASCEARVGAKHSDEFGFGTSETPVWANQSLELDRIYGRNYASRGTNFAYAMFVNRGFAIYADLEHENVTAGGIDLSLECAQQLNSWVQDAHRNNGSADITTHDTRR